MIYLERLYEIGPVTGGPRQTRCCGLAGTRWVREPISWSGTVIGARGTRLQ